jgi:pimeloyl-ACP methyl ester carboxylesterase
MPTLIKGKKRRVLIIVHGAWRANLHNKSLNQGISKALNLLTAAHEITRKDYHSLVRYLKKHYDVVELFRWDGRALPRAKDIPESKSFKNLLDKYRDDSVDIIAVSLGGYVVEMGLKKSKNQIEKILYIGAVHNRKHIPKNAKKIINVYSGIDKMYMYANNLYEGLGNAVLDGKNVINIPLKNVRHDELGTNILLKGEKFAEKKLYNLYRYLLLEK